ncbi:hypothetical protein F3Y22_tig00111276pilonHSYRG00113 [Hibiscus syriacus]|uniref:NB-ARC domain-containing protein n=1 Tax=Hibiscus syriacus TaxID=106335 RepID=A0A6A2YRR4_HIBSY|nr:hypothetical protein F3Y22_tig00111276pilonHSYRG00113 [Hibiscus syriacus]
MGFLRSENQWAWRDEELDDAQLTNYVHWKELSSPFTFGAKNSKIIVTTCDDNVAAIVRNVPTYYLDVLSDDDCWKLFVNHAFDATSPSKHPNMMEIGKAIVNRCNGLPLAAKTLGGLLRCKLDPDDWSKLLHSNFWDILPDDASNILPAFRLSYYYLPSHLKRLLEFSKNNGDAEDRGNEYFRDLRLRSFFNNGRGRKVGSSPVLCPRKYDVRKKFKRLPEGGGGYVKKLVIYPMSKKNMMCKRNLRLYLKQKVKAKGLSTFLNMRSSYASNVLIHDLLVKSSFRVLSLAKYENIGELPEEIGNLKHLRSLDLSETSIRRFSGVVTVGDEFYGNGHASDKSFGSLEILCFEDMAEWEEWFCSSDEVFSLLQELFLRSCSKIPLPCRLRELVIIDSNIDSSILEQMLQQCTHLEKLSMRDCSGIASLPDSRLSPAASSKPQFFEYTFVPRFYIFSNPRRIAHHEFDQTSSLGLSKFKIIARANAVRLPIPCDVGNRRLSEIVISRRRERCLQTHPSLTYFEVSDTELEMKSFPDENLPSSLTSLTISDLPNLKSLDFKGFQHLTSLQRLYIYHCPKLQAPTKMLPRSLLYLFIVTCPLLKEHCQEEKGKDWHNISHILVIKIDNEVFPSFSLTIHFCFYFRYSSAWRGGGNLEQLDVAPLTVELRQISSESQFDRVIAEAQQLEES